MKRQTHNPLLNLPASAQIIAMPSEAKAPIRALLIELRDSARAEAQKCWTTHKAPMAVYWKCVGVYSNHLARLLSRDTL